jgi:hypothetical protein
LGITLCIVALASSAYQANSKPEIDYFTPELVDGAYTERLDWYGEKYQTTKVVSFERG